MRIVLTVVGVSLIDETLGKLVGRLGRVPGVKHEESRSLQRAFERLMPTVVELRGQPGGVTEGEGTFDYQSGRHQGVRELVQVLGDLWRSDADERLQRQHSPAELASLSLLAPKLVVGDQVWLLFSETHESAFCAAILQEVMATAGEGSALCGPGVRVETKLLRGVQMKAPERVVEEGLHSWAEVLDDAQTAAASSEHSVLLNITGGYKGIVPLGVLLAAGLSAGEKPISVFYLYEESDQLLFLPGTDLVSFDLSLFDDLRKDWLKMPGGGLSWPDESGMLTDSFVNRVVKGRKDLVVQEGNRLKPTVTGSLLLAVWKARRQIGRTKPVPPPG